MSRHEIVVYMKSGNSFKIQVENLTVKKINGQISELEWEGMKGQLMFLDVSQVEAIMKSS
jgi:hypothetical protein